MCALSRQCENCDMTEEISTRLLARLRRSVTTAASYLYSKQSDNGGFCFFKYGDFDRPNLRDTYHAVTALRLYGLEVPRVAELLEFLRGANRDDVTRLYYHAFVLQELPGGRLASSDMARIRALPLPPMDVGAETDSDRRLKRILRTLALQQRFAAITDPASARSMVKALVHDGANGDRANLRETCSSLKILTLLGEDLSRHHDSRELVDALQRPSTGFAEMVNSQYCNLEIIVAGVQCCSLLDLPIRYVADILQFVLACQSTDGSFSRVPAALPDIAFTHQAMQIIGWLVPDLLPGGKSFQ